MTGVPYPYGSLFDGTMEGPDYLRKWGLVEHLAQKNIPIIDDGNIDIGPENRPAWGDCRRINWRDRMSLARMVIRSVHEHTLDIYENGGFPLTIGGDHSITAGAVMAAQRHFGDIGLISIDSHSDAGDLVDMDGDEVLMSHGNFINAITGSCPKWLNNRPNGGIRSSNVSVVGVQDLNTEYEGGVMFACDSDIGTVGIERVANWVIRRALDETKGIYLSFDIDALNKRIAPGANYPGGSLNMEEAKKIVSMVAATGKLVGADLVEVCPNTDRSDGVTARSAIEIISTILEKHITQ